MIKSYRFTLNISPEQYLDYYRGTVRRVLVHTAEGLSLEFPAHLLQKHVSPTGIHGQFILYCDENNKFLNLEKN